MSPCSNMSHCSASCPARYCIPQVRNSSNREALLSQTPAFNETLQGAFTLPRGACSPQPCYIGSTSRGQRPKLSVAKSMICYGSIPSTPEGFLLPKARWPANNASLIDDEQTIHCTLHFGAHLQGCTCCCSKKGKFFECLQPLSFSERATYLMSLLNFWDIW